MIEYLLAKFGKWAAIVGGVLAAVLYAFLKGRSEGKASGQQEVVKQIAKQEQKLDDKIDRIDRTVVDFDTAIGNLRRRGKGADKK